MGGATSSLPMQQRIGQWGRCPSRCGDESGSEDAAPPGPAANRPMTKSKRPMTKRHEPHVRNKTPHEETGRTAAALGQAALPFWHELPCRGEANSPVLLNDFPCDPKWIVLYGQFRGSIRTQPKNMVNGRTAYINRIRNAVINGIQPSLRR